MNKRPFIGVTTRVLCTMIVVDIPGAVEEGLTRQASRASKGKGPNPQIADALEFRATAPVQTPATCTSIPAPVDDADADTLAACVDDTLESDTCGLAYHIDRLRAEGRSWGEVYATLCGRGNPFTYRQVAEHRGVSANACQVAASNWRSANKVTA